MQTSAVSYIVSQVVNNGPHVYIHARTEMANLLLCTQVHCAYAPQSFVADQLTHKARRKEDHKEEKKQQ